MNYTIYISLTEDNAALSAYPVTNGYLFYVIDPYTYEWTSNYYSNTAQGLTNFLDNDEFVTNLVTLSGGLFSDYENGYFNYTRTTTLPLTGLIGETSSILFSLSGIDDTNFNIIKIVFDKYGDGTTLISTEKDFYLTYNNTSALQIINETNEYKSPKYKVFEAKYQTLSTSFFNTYTPKFYVYRDNGIINVINLSFTVAKKSFLSITQDFKILDIYPNPTNILIKMQNPVDNQIYFTSLSAG